MSCYKHYISEISAIKLKYLKWGEKERKSSENTLESNAYMINTQVNKDIIQIV